MKNRFIAAVALAASLGATSVAAQYIAFPIDSLQGVRGQVIPLGSSTSANFDEGRVQMLIPARFLPAAGATVIGVEVSPHVTGTVNYDTLAISLGHTTLTSLTLTYATNLPNPTTVFGQSSFSMSYPSSSTWNSLLFAQSFVYDGSSNLIVEFQKKLDTSMPKSTVSHQTDNFPARADLPSPLFAFGATGAFNAPTGQLFSASSRPLVRLLFQNSATMTIEGVQGGTSNDYFAIGTIATLRVRGNTGDAYVLAFDVALAGIPLAIPGTNGLFYLSFPNVLINGAPMVGGVGTVPIPIPNIPAAVGTQFYFQSARIDGASPPNVDLTNIVDAIIAN